MPGLQGVGPIDFIFDDQSEKSIILAAWDGYVRTRKEEIRSQFCTAPRFENDQVFLPLQAADYLAGSVRMWEERKMKTGISSEKIDWETTPKAFDIVSLTMSEDDLARMFIESVQNQAPNALVMDVKVSFGDRRP